MSFYPSFYNNFPGNNSTFQSLPTNYVPPPPQPPPFFIPPPAPVINQEKIDQDVLKTYESKIPTKELTKMKVKSLSISEVHNKIHNLVNIVNKLKMKENFLSENINMLSADDWKQRLKEAEENKALINKLMSEVNGPYLDMLRKLLAKRSSKRLRQKRVRLERKREKEEMLKESKERSRKIDENLQKIQDAINKVKQEEEAKIQADMVLKEVLRKKSDAKKCLTKLDALLKLRKARQNTARGRGENVSESEAAAFNSNIEKLKSLWIQKLSIYEKEEAELRAKLKQASDQLNVETSVTKTQVTRNLQEWKDVLFGGTLPQAEFGGDVDRFIAVRSQWDRYIRSEGTCIPVGWVPPSSLQDKDA